MEERKDYEIINVEARIPKIIDVIIPNAIGHGGSMDLSNYYDKQEVDAKVGTVTGQKGDPGPKGDKGDPFTYADFTAEQLEGLKGPKGDVGPMGPVGPQGLQGNAGPQGLPGERGPQGLQGQPGPKGDKGEQGQQGPIGPVGPQGPKGEPLRFSDLTPDQIAQLKGPKGDPGPQGPQGPAGVGGSGGGSVDLSQYAKKTDLGNYLSRTDANNNYAQKGWSANTFAYKGDLGAFIRKTEIGQYALTPGDAASRYVNNIQAQSFAKTADLGNYRTIKDADNLYLKKTDADSAYAKKSDADNTYVSKTGDNNVTGKINISQTAGLSLANHILESNPTNLVIKNKANQPILTVYPSVAYLNGREVLNQFKADQLYISKAQYDKDMTALKSGGSADMSKYYTKAEVDALVSNADISGFISALRAGNIVVDDTSLSGVLTLLAKSILGFKSDSEIVSTYPLVLPTWEDGDTAVRFENLYPGTKLRIDGTEYTVNDHGMVTYTLPTDKTKVKVEYCNVSGAPLPTGQEYYLQKAEDPDKDATPEVFTADNGTWTLKGRTLTWATKPYTKATASAPTGLVAKLNSNVDRFIIDCNGGTGTDNSSAQSNSERTVLNIRPGTIKVLNPHNNTISFDVALTGRGSINKALYNGTNIIGDHNFPGNLHLFTSGNGPQIMALW